MAEKMNFQDPGFTPIEPDPQYILQVNGLKKYFPIKGGMIGKTTGYVKAVDGVKLFTGILAGLDEENNILLDTPNGQLSFPKKAAATVKPVVDMEGIENVDLSE